MSLQMDDLTGPIRNRIQLARHKWFDNFVFVHINKTGGTSLAKALKIPTKHSTALEKISEIGQAEWDSRFTFAVIRNPWDKVVSHYHYRVQTDQTNLANQSIDFKEWVKLAYRDKDKTYYNKIKMFMPQTDWISDDNGRIIVDYVCRFESLTKDFQSVCDRLQLKTQLPHLKYSERGGYQQYYDEETKLIVKDHFQKDIENFQYKF